MEGPEWWVAPTIGLVGVLVGSGIGLVGVFLGTSRQIRHQERQARLAVYVRFLESVVGAHAALLSTAGVWRTMEDQQAALSRLSAMWLAPQAEADNLEREAKRLRRAVESAQSEASGVFEGSRVQSEVMAATLRQVRLTAPDRVFTAALAIQDQVRKLLGEVSIGAGDEADAETSEARFLSANADLHAAVDDFLDEARADVRAPGTRPVRRFRGRRSV